MNCETGRKTVHFPDSLQARCRGYLLRKQVLKTVRSEYEDLVKEINSSKQLQLNVLTWTHPDKVCYPRFKPMDKDIPSVITPIEGAIEDGQRTKYKEIGVDDICLPRDRETLIELRRQLSMELLWLKQAIDSRQQYLALKKELQCQAPNLQFT